MKFKRIVMVSVAAATFMGMTLNVSAARSSADKYVNRLKKSGQVDLILDVEAYRAAYSDLEEAFGDDEDAYIRHYLTAGVYEGRTKGVLFDPLAYAEGYDDIRDAFGDDVLGIITHYVTFGVKENRTIGTAAGHEDIASVRESGAVQEVVRRKSSSAVTGNETVQKPAEPQTPSETPGNETVQKPVEPQTPSEAPENETVQTPAEPQTPSEAPGNETVQKPTEPQTPSEAPGNETVQTPTEPQAPSEVSGSQTEDIFAGICIGHTTSIYANDGITLIRVEYYDENNNLVYYSDVIDYDSSTESYTENIYSYDEKEGRDVLKRTDTYVNGVCSSVK